jgi:hypothetical protein
MASRAVFGPPLDQPVRGGLHVSVHVVPVFEGRLVVFDIESHAARGRWLPWAVIDFGQNPYEAAATLADDWCGVTLADLSLVDVMSFAVDGGGWELAIVFRAELESLPATSGERTPVPFEAGKYDAIGNFDPVDLQRWVESRPPAPASGGRLVF